MDPKETKKVERLVTAIYMLTGFFDDKEPMKWSLRELGNGLLSAKNFQKNVSAIMSMLTVAKHAGFISDMNFDIVHKEFARILPSQAELENVLKIKDEIEAPQNQPPVQEEKPAAPALYIASSVLAEKVIERPAELLPTISIKDKLAEPQQVVEREKKGLKDYGVVAVKKNTRQSVIINLLKRKKEIMIKDVSPLIDGVSEKTIQRELLAMVQAGVLTKTGEKRWSRYTLAE